VQTAKSKAADMFTIDPSQQKMKENYIHTQANGFGQKLSCCWKEEIHHKVMIRRLQQSI
jgi:hypothetical protein